MKSRWFALILTLSLAVWAQEPPSSSAPPNSTPAPQTKSCCHHGADTKGGKGCCHHASAETKEGAGCCGKDESDMKDCKSCCGHKDMKICMEQCKKEGQCGSGKDCCTAAAKDKKGTNCCGAEKCVRHQHTTTAS